jgi:CheY-like chemotaxis protein
MANSQPGVKQLFIIDDDLEDQEIFMEAVKVVNDGIICYSAINGEDAIKQLTTDVVMLPDLIFLDMNMPRLNGKQVLRELKNTRSLVSIPVIMYSTSFAPRDIEEIKELGAVHHLLKPSRFDDLCKSLTQILSTDWQNKRPATSPH